GAQPLVNQVNARGLRVARGVSHRALFERGRGAGHAYDDVASAVAAAADARDEGLEHLLDRVEILDVAAAHGPEYLNVLRLAPEHLEGLGPNVQNLARVLVYRHRRRLVEDDAAFGREEACGDRPKLNRLVVRK